MGLMARFETVLNLAESADDSGGLGRAWDDLKAERQKFEVREAVIGTKLEAYLKSPAIAQRWDKLAEAMTGLVELRGSDAAHDAEHREQMLQKVLRQLEKLSAVPVDGQAWRDVYDAILERKAALIHGVLKEPMVFRTSWIPWGR